jgi:hypothetical protein
MISREWKQMKSRVPGGFDTRPRAYAPWASVASCCTIFEYSASDCATT